jgi:putative ABC transport system permease protein
MPPLRLVFKNLFKHKIRAILTIASLAIALFLLCLLQSLVTAINAGVKAAAANRLIVQSTVSLFVGLPKAYESKLRAVEGVENVTAFNWFGGYYRKPENFFGQFAVDPKAFLSMYPEIEIVEGSAEQFETERTACIVGEDTANRFDIKVGQTLPIVGALYPRLDEEPWGFRVAAIYRSNKKNVDSATLYFNTKYMEEALLAGQADGPEGVSIYVLQIAPDADRVTVASTIDAIFENGPQKTLTSTEAEFQAQFVGMIGGLPFFLNSIGMGVFVAILLASLNTMLMGAREQTRDVGVLKSLGFSDGTVFSLMLMQSLFLCGLGGGIGIAVAKLTEPGLTKALGTSFPGYSVADGTLVAAAVVTAVLGLVAGIAPAWRARSLDVVGALRATV